MLVRGGSCVNHEAPSKRMLPVRTAEEAGGQGRYGRYISRLHYVRRK